MTSKALYSPSSLTTHAQIHINPPRICSPLASLYLYHLLMTMLHPRLALIFRAQVKTTLMEKVSNKESSKD